MNIEDVVRKLGGVWPVTSALMGARRIKSQGFHSALAKAKSSATGAKLYGYGQKRCTNQRHDKCRRRK